MRRAATMLTAVLLAATACSGSDDERDDGLPVPAEAPSASGMASGPALEPRVLLASADALEEQLGGVDDGQVQRRAGAFVSGRTVVGYSVDDVSGYDLDSGEQLWRASLDLGGGTVCFASEPDRSVEHLTVVYQESDGECTRVATVRVADGEVVRVAEPLDPFEEFEGERAGGPFKDLLTVEGTDHLVDLHGVVWRMVEGEPEPIARLESDSYWSLLPTPDGETLVGPRLNDDECRVDGYALPSFETIWSRDGATLFPDLDDPSCVIASAQGDPSWLVQETTGAFAMVQLDPATGEVLGSGQEAKDDTEQPSEGELDLSAAAMQLDATLGLPGGDMVLPQLDGLARYSLESGRVAWSLDLAALRLESDEERPLTTVLPQGLTQDGHVVASVSNATSVEIIAVDAETGELAARWPVPKEFRNGFQAEPRLTLFEGGVVLTRDFRAWASTFVSYAEVQPPEQDRYDIGIFAFPDPEDDESGD